MKTKFLPLLLSFFLAVPAFSQNWVPYEVPGLPDDYGPFGIDVVSADIVWATTFDQSFSFPIPLNHIPKVIKTTDGGLTWAVYDVPDAIGRISFDIQAFGPDTAYITTQDYSNGAGRGVFKTTDGGSTWNEIFLDPAGGVWIRFFDNNEGILINRTFMAKTYDAGQNWEPIPAGNIPVFGTNEFTILGNGNAGCIVIGDNIWFNTNGGRVFRSANRGENWQASSVNQTPTSWVLSIDFVDELNGVALVQDPNLIDDSQLSFTDDGGVTWIPYESDMGDVYATLIHIPGTDSSFLALGDSFLPIPDGYSTDYCHSFERSDETLILGPVEFLSPTLGWAGRSGTASPNNTDDMFRWQGDIFAGPSHTAETLSMTDLQIHPNPVQDRVMLTLPHASPLSVEVLSLDSKYRWDIPVSSLPEISLSHLPAGAYLLRVVTSAGAAVEKIWKL